VYAHAYAGKTLQPDEHPTIVDTWLAMERLLASGPSLCTSSAPVLSLTCRSGKVKTIGVSNFGVPLLRKLAADPRVKTVPATNQVELHPCLPLAPLRAYAKDAGIVLTAYSPIGAPAPDKPSPLLTDDDVLRIASARGVTPAQVVLSWGVQHGVIVIPKTENEARMKTNISVRLPFCFYASPLISNVACEAGRGGDARPRRAA
jgi:glycerol 2-dehydrogenase (NADP+)